jgi:hypothetical protein
VALPYGPLCNYRPAVVSYGTRAPWNGTPPWNKPCHGTTATPTNTPTPTTNHGVPRGSPEWATWHPFFHQPELDTCRDLIGPPVCHVDRRTIHASLCRDATSVMTSPGATCHPVSGDTCHLDIGHSPAKNAKSACHVALSGAATCPMYGPATSCHVSRADWPTSSYGRHVNADVILPRHCTDRHVSSSCAATCRLLIGPRQLYGLPRVTVRPRVHVPRVTVRTDTCLYGLYGQVQSASQNLPVWLFGQKAISSSYGLRLR